nr:protein kinase family protein [Calidifontibacillus oryziterrae]
MNISKNQDCKLSPGTVINGKWHHNSYRVVKPLGYGATGIVYLAEGNQDLVAIKISNDSLAITSEVNVLRHFSKVQGRLGPSLLDVDDWIRPNFAKAMPFYVMEYLKGIDFLTFIEKNGNEWLSVLILQLLADLERLHKHGWIFGDLKPDNLLVVGPPQRVRWLDVGGTTMNGRSIKEFTEFYDRGYWGLGSRKAEPAYDLFAVAMIMLNTQFPNRFSKKTTVGNNLPQLVTAIEAKPALRKYEKVMIRAIQGKYQTATEMRYELLHIANRKNDIRQDQTRQTIKSSNSFRKATTSKRKTNNKNQRERKFKGVLETIVIAFLLFIAYFLYIASQML